MATKTHYTTPNRTHGGSTQDEIQKEPDWANANHNRIGFRDTHDRQFGYTHAGDDSWDEEEHREFLAWAKKESEQLGQEIHDHELVTVREFMAKQEDYHLRFPENHPRGWRYVLQTTEDFIKYKQDWPVNKKKRQQQEEEKKKKEAEEQEKAKEKGNHKETGQSQDPKKEHEWRRDRGENETHHDAHAVNSDDTPGNKSPESLEDKYSPQEIALLRLLQSESELMQTIKQNDGSVKSPVKLADAQDLSIDEADQFTPDNWIPRSPHLIRLTGKHPLNGEPELTALFKAGLITPNQLHYVRNHGPVPHLLWETHQIDVADGKLILSMDDLQNNFQAINIAVALACDGNRRKELNMIRRSKGFSWGAGAISCAFWKGALLRDLLLAAGIDDESTRKDATRRWVHFEGADELSEGKYATSIPLAYAMDPENDVMLAYEMNDARLPPDHGYPVRLMIPGFVGGRCVKWLRRIWVSEKENDSYYHIWDNRVVPSFIREKDSEFAKTMFHHPSTVCNEQNLNSIIVKPEQGERISLADVKSKQTYRISGIAYDGGGHEVQRVEVSLDNGKTWLYCVREFPDYPVRHGRKFWTWLHWHVDVGLSHLVRAESIIVRCFNVFKNTQPREPSWNIMGMMNNCWYTVRPEIVRDEDQDAITLQFRHPCEPGTGKGGWMQPSTENQMDQIKHEVASPQKQFTREEIEKHNKEDDCWIIVNGKVYDATSVLDWHPGGKATILGHAGKVHAETTEAFESIHDDYAEQKLSECVIGVVTEKVQGFIKKQAEEAAKEKANSAETKSDIILNHHRWNVVRFVGKHSLSQDTNRYSFKLPAGTKKLGLGTCQHLQLGFHFSDRLVVRPYTPTRPIFEKEEDGTFDLVVKTYPPDKSQPGGTMSNILDCLEPGEEIEVKGPTGEIIYLGQGQFKINQQECHFNKVTLVLGGSGITPGYQLISRVLRAKKLGEEEDQTVLRVIDANKTEGDILLREELDRLAKEHPKQFQITHVLSHSSEDWKGEKGHVNKEMLEKYAFGPGKDTVALLCGPPTMIQKAVLPALQEMGYKEDENVFGF
ncbi:Uncharacterized protein PECH_007246 [Penicillium ucsense]|uniref:Nitrate reductase [NADPH] n=1 Tax=Penicillium ucsense TaxID=2839758 RepID=A0A8J8VWR4_9EURO|nr:Uncharacterized protein PECM_001749 [Penicillium ucsense]KAF7735078.1 Uncharacterized protein PECH_007246 [Penicillium ucsense]